MLLRAYPQKFLSRAEIFWWILSFFSPKDGFRVLKIYVEKQHLLLGGNEHCCFPATLTNIELLHVEISDHPGSSLASDFELSLSETENFSEFFIFFKKIDIFSKNDFACICKRARAHHIATHYSNICCCTPLAEISVEISASRPIFTVFVICGVSDFEMLLK